MAITKITTPELFDFSATNTALQLPTGTTLQRPTNASAGQWRFNTDEKYVEYYDGTTPYDATKWFQIDTEAIPSPVPVGSENFNVNTYFGNGATQIIDAKFNEAANFNGSSSVITSSSLGTALNVSSLSFSLWFKTNLNDSTDRILISSYDGSGNARFYASLLNSGLSVVIYGSSSAYVLYFINTVTIGTWYHLSVTHTGTTTTVYLNGTAITPSSTSGSAVAIKIAGSPQPLTMGQLQGSIGTYALNGKIDQVRIFDTALTATQAEDLYTDETTTTAATLNFPAGAGCIAAYQLDGNGDDISTNYNGTTTNIGYTGLKFTPDLVWIKQRSGSASHSLQDSVRGAGQSKNIYSDNTAAEGTYGQYGYLSAFGTDGFTVVQGSGSHTNANSSTYVAWNWRAAGFANAFNVLEVGTITTSSSASTAGITAGSITTGWNVSANRDAGFSIVKYTGTGGTGTVGTGLSSPAELIIRKNLDASSTGADWYVYAPASPYFGYLQTTDAFASDNNAAYSYNQTVPTGSIFNVGNTYSGNINNDDYIAYCFRSVVGYQKIGSYTWTGTSYTAGTMVTGLGFTPRFVMIKGTDVTSNWQMYDNKRVSGTQSYALYGDLSDAESTSGFQGIKFDSDGFSAAAGVPDGNVTGSQSLNQNGKTYIYLAIA